MIPKSVPILRTYNQSDESDFDDKSESESKLESKTKSPLEEKRELDELIEKKLQRNLNFMNKQISSATWTLTPEIKKTEKELLDSNPELNIHNKKTPSFFSGYNRGNAVFRGVRVAIEEDVDLTDKDKIKKEDNQSDSSVSE